MDNAQGETQPWKRLGALLIQRRVELDPRFRNRQVFSEETHLDYRLIYDAEQAKRTNFGQSTLAALEQGYRLAPGAIREALAGGDLTPAAAPELHRVDPLAFANPQDPVEQWLLNPPAHLKVTPEEISALLITHRVVLQRSAPVFAEGYDREMRELRRRA